MAAAREQDRYRRRGTRGGTQPGGTQPGGTQPGGTQRGGTQRRGTQRGGKQRGGKQPRSSRGSTKVKRVQNRRGFLGRIMAVFQRSSSDGDEKDGSDSEQQQELIEGKPEIFVKRGKQDLHMGHKPIATTKAATTTAATTATKTKTNHVQKQPPQISGTSSTALWVAQANAAAFGSSKKTVDADSDSEGQIHQNMRPGSLHYEEKGVEDGNGNKGGIVNGNGDDEEYNSSFSFVEEELDVVEHNSQEVVEEDPVAFYLGLPERKITLRFDEYDEMQTCLHINDYTKHEISKCWYKREDYDRMVDLARKTASKAVKREKELREELENMLGSGNDRDASHGSDKDDVDADVHPNNSDKKDKKKNSKGKKKKPIEYRGLETWTPAGAIKGRSLKESAIELVWNEQSRQWEEGTFDPYAISKVYLPISLAARAIARERAVDDEVIVKKLMEQEQLRAEKKRNRTVYRKSKAALKKTAKSASHLVTETGKIAKKTGKVGMIIGKRGVKAGVATATLDPRMLKEALKIRVAGNKKRECERKKIVTPSRAAHEREVEEELSLGNTNSVGQLTSEYDEYSHSNGTGTISQGDFDMSSATGSIFDYGYEDADNGDDSGHGSRTSRSQYSDSGKKKKSKMKLLGGPELKLLGVVPIPGTKKVSKEERRVNRMEKRIQRMPRRPSWEAGVSDGKY